MSNSPEGEPRNNLQGHSPAKAIAGAIASADEQRRYTLPSGSHGPRRIASMPGRNCAWPQFNGLAIRGSQQWLIGRHCSFFLHGHC